MYSVQFWNLPQSAQCSVQTEDEMLHIQPKGHLFHPDCMQHVYAYLFCAKLRSGLSTDCPNKNLPIYALLFGFMYTLVKQWLIVRHSKTFLPTKKTWSTVSKKERERGMKLFFSRAILAMDALSTLCMHCNAVLMVNIGTTFQ